MIEASAVMASAHNSARGLRAGGWLIGALSLGLLAWLAVDADHAGRVLAEVNGFAVAEPRLWQSLALGGLALVQLCLWSSVLVASRQMFVELAAGRPAEAATRARSVARWLWALLVWSLAVKALTSAIATWYYPDGEHLIAVQLGLAQLTTALAALMASFLARAFALGAELWQDHQEIV